MQSIDLADLTDEEISAMSGRICAPGIPPKSKAEAREHIHLIRQLLLHERQLAEVEARENRERREKSDMSLDYWTTQLIPNFEKLRWQKQSFAVWSKMGIPPSLRSQAWPLAIGNERNITPRMYDICSKKASHRGHEIAMDKRQAEEVSPDNTGSPPRDLAKYHVREQTAAAKAIAAVRSLREEDPTFFSPKVSKLESMMQIAVDLPRTIISRSSNSSHAAHRGHQRTASNASSCSSVSTSPQGSPVSSPRGGSFQGDERVAPSPVHEPVTHFHNPVNSGNANYNFASAEAPTHAVADGGLQGSSMLISTMCDEALLGRISRTLCAFVEYRPDIGYVQGMSYLAAMILLHVESDETGFICLVNLLHKSHFQYFYSVHHQGMGVYIAAFDECLKRSLPQLYTNFTVIGVHPQMYVIDWWMSLFSRALPYETAARCWDLFLLDEAFLFRISIAILVYFSPHIHEESSLDEVMVFLSKVQRQHIDEKKFFAIVDDDNSCGGSLQTIRDILKERLKQLPSLEEQQLDL